VIGSVVRLFAGGENDDRLARIQRSIVNEVGSIKDLIGYSDPVATWPQARDEQGRRVLSRRQAPGSSNQKGKVRSKLPPSGARSFEILVGEISR
jgi:hypothetical protein